MIQKAKGLFNSLSHLWTTFLSCQRMTEKNLWPKSWPFHSVGNAGLILSGQYVTIWAVVCPIFTNIPMILANFLDTIIQFLWKILVTTIAILSSSKIRHTYQNIQHWDITLHFLFSHCKWVGAGVPLRSETEIMGNWYSIKTYWFKSPSPWRKLNCDLPIFIQLIPGWQCSMWQVQIPTTVP